MPPREGRLVGRVGAGGGETTPVRALRAVLIVGVLLVAGLLVLEMSGSARRTLATNQVKQVTFVAVLPHGGTVCEARVTLPAGAGYANLEIGTYGRLMPAVDLSFRSEDGRLDATGHLDAGARQGQVNIPIHVREPAELGTLCVRFPRTRRLALAGQILPPGGAQVNGQTAEGYLAVRFFTAAPRSWWQMLHSLEERFDYGKSGWIGTLTFPLVCVAALGVWVLALARLWRFRA